MDTKFNEEVDKRIQKQINEFKKTIGNHLKKLERIESLIKDAEIKTQLKDVIDDLRHANEIGLDDLRIKPDDDVRYYKHYEYNEKQYEGLTNEIEEHKSKKATLNPGRYAKVLVSLNNKKGKIYKNQLKIADKVIVEKLEKYKEDNNIDYNNLYNIEKKFDKNLLKFGTEAQLTARTSELEDKIQNADFSDKKSIADYKANKKEFNTLSKQLKRIQKKTGKAKETLSNVIAHDVKPSIIDRMKKKAQQIHRNLSDDYYIKRIAEFEAKGASR